MGGLLPDRPVLGTGVALAAGAGSESDPLVTLSYLNETVLPKLKKDVEASAETRQAELTTQFNQIAAQGGGGPAPPTRWSPSTPDRG